VSFDLFEENWETVGPGVYRFSLADALERSLVIRINFLTQIATVEVNEINPAFAKEWMLEATEMPVGFDGLVNSIAGIVPTFIEEKPEYHSAYAGNLAFYHWWDKNQARIPGLVFQNGNLFDRWDNKPKQVGDPLPMTPDAEITGPKYVLASFLNSEAGESYQISTMGRTVSAPTTCDYELMRLKRVAPVYRL
jgi:hypothetical protein